MLDSLTFWIVLFHVTHLIGFFVAIHALMHVRTAQGAVAWVVALIATPSVSIPLYLIFGRNKFNGYVEVIRKVSEEQRNRVNSMSSGILAHRVAIDDEPDFCRVFEQLAKQPFTKGNSIQLLLDGDATFNAIFDAIEKAEKYVLIEFFIVHHDKIGNQLKDLLCKKSEEGVLVYFLYDEIGSHSLSSTYVGALEQKENVEIHRFKTTRGPANRFQLNFRNHRKIVVVDGQVGFVGGLNVGDEYLGRNPIFGPWRDTHSRVCGPAVQCLQTTFVIDWYWATRTILDLDWKCVERGSANALVIPMGPADKLETGTLFFLNAIQLAKKRLWLATPYFVPDPTIVDALQLAALRGVDVRIVLPENYDHYMTYMAAFSYLPEIADYGIKIYRYRIGFMHQKILLIDDDLASVGTANLDNRSMRLNFEVNLLVQDAEFAEQVQNMLEMDFSNSRLADVKDYTHKSLKFRVVVQLCRLLSPVL